MISIDGTNASLPGNTVQYIGSKVSLVSNSEIRYEGILYAMDITHATISLSDVRSFGTEDRPTARPVPPKDEIYKFIMFKGSDVKGIDVVEYADKEDADIIITDDGDDDEDDYWIK